MPEVCECGWRMLPIGNVLFDVYLKCERCGKKQKNYSNFVTDWKPPMGGKLSMVDKERLADEHAEWMANFMYKVVKVIAKEEFLHGYKHGVQSVEKK